MKAFVPVLLFLASAPVCFAPPPMVTGDVPTADKGLVQWFPGSRYQENEHGHPERLLPFTEIVYGISDRQEISFATAAVSKDGHHGIRDSVIGTKYVFLKETDTLPGIAASFELKLPTGDESRGLGSGEFDCDLRLRTQKTWGWFTGIGNVGYTVLTDPEFGGVTTLTENVWLLSFAQEWKVTERTKLLSEIYFVSREEPDAPNRFAANVGFKHHLRDNFAVHAAFGQSLREDGRGGPDLRVYFGFKWEFDTVANLSKAGFESL
jgi:hypothetical protein